MVTKLLPAPGCDAAQCQPLAGTTGATGLGVGPGKQRELRSPIAAPPSSLHRCTEPWRKMGGREGGWGAAWRPLAHTRLVSQDQISFRFSPQSGSLLLPLATHHRGHRTFPNVSLPDGMTGCPSVPRPRGSHNTGRSALKRGQPRAAQASWSPNSRASWQIVSKEKCWQGREATFSGDYPVGDMRKSEAVYELLVL